MKEFYNIFKRSIIAGMCIGLGCIAYTMMSNVFVGSFLFSLGLIAVVALNCNLYTGKIGYAECTLWDLKYYITIMIGNIIGLSIVCPAISNIYGLSDDVQNICNFKINEDFMTALVRSFACGILMYIAVEGYKRTKNIFVVMLPVIMFVILGFDHCIANIGYLMINSDFSFTWNILTWILGNSLGSIFMCWLHNPYNE